MATYGLTNFTEFIEGPDEQYTLDASRIVRHLDITNATIAVRQQAVADFLGTNTVSNITVLGGGPQVGFKYLSREIPLSYAYSETQPAELPLQSYLYAANIVRGQPMTPTGTSIATDPSFAVLVGGNFARYRYTVEFTTRTYDVKPDDQVEAQAATTISSGGTSAPILGSLSPSPITGFPDEGQLIAGVAFTQPDALAQYTNWPPPSAPKFSTGSRYITRIWRPGNRLKVIPFGMLKFPSDDLTIREGFPYREVNGSLKYTWHLVPEDGIPLNAIQNSINCINSGWFDSFPPQTLLFTNAEMRRFIGPLGDVLYNLEYYFSWQPNPDRGPSTAFPDVGPGVPGAIRHIAGFPQGWNFILRTKSVAGQTFLNYDKVGDNNGQAPYSTADFSALFRPDQFP